MTPGRPPARGKAPSGRAFLVILLAVAATLLAAAPAPVAAAPAAAPGTPVASAAGPFALAADPPETSAQAALVMDAADGKVLWERNAHKPMLVASTTKILTALVAESAYEQAARLPVPAQAENVDGTRFGFERGMKVGRDALLATLILTSANDAAETLAVNFPNGGREGFLSAMQERCRQLGCTDSTWRDPAGLDAPGHKASAADLAIVGRALLDRPFLARLAATDHMSIRWSGHSQVITNHNKLVRYDGAKGMIGVKTGYTSKSGHTIVAAQKRGDRTMIAVVLKSTDYYDDARKLLAWGFKAPQPAQPQYLGVSPVANRDDAGAPAGSEAQAAGVRIDGTELASRSLLPVSSPLLMAAGVGLLVMLLGILLVARARRRRRRFRLFT